MCSYGVPSARQLSYCSPSAIDMLYSSEQRIMALLFGSYRYAMTYARIYHCFTYCVRPPLCIYSSTCTGSRTQLNVTCAAALRCFIPQDLPCTSSLWHAQQCNNCILAATTTLAPATTGGTTMHAHMGTSSTRGRPAPTTPTTPTTSSHHRLFPDWPELQWQQQQQCDSSDQHDW
jgi:hypothetical protein